MKRLLLIILSGCTLAFCGSLKAQISFSDPVSYSFLPNATFSKIRSADFNMDGYKDIIGIGMQATGVSILLNKGDGTFQSGFSQSLTQSGYAITIGDFNKDGYQDFAVIEGIQSGYGQVDIFLNNPSNPGQFTQGATFQTAQNPTDLESIDFNNDGNLDLIITSASDGLSFFQNDGNGGFGVAGSQNAGQTPWCAAVGDLNGDGFNDIVIGSQYAQNGDVNDIKIYLNNQNGTFTLSNSYAAGTTVFSVVIKDINNDNKPDIVSTSFNDNAIFSLINNGNGNFAVFGPLAAPSGTTALAGNDFNGDGLTDLIVSGLSANALDIFLNNVSAPGTFSAAGTIPAVYTVAMLSEDFNNDNKPDLAALDMSTGTLSVFLNTTTFSLPVDLKTFTGQINNGNADLKWTSGVESEFEGYEIEKSLDGAAFIRIGSVKAEGSGKSYHFSAVQNERIAYYRLKLINKNGNPDYSDVVTIQDPLAKNGITLTPNPANNFIHIQTTTNETLHIYDGSGKLVLTESLSAGDNKIDVHSLSSGIYFGVIGHSKLKFIKN